MGKLPPALAPLVLCLLMVGERWHSAAGKHAKQCNTHKHHVTECLHESISRFLKLVQNGSQEWALPPLDPITLTDVVICHGTGPVTANIGLTQATLSGLSTNRVVSASVDAAESRLEFVTHQPAIVVKGGYNLAGNFTEIEAVGDGGALIVLKDVTIYNFLTWRMVGGHVRLKTYRVHIEPKDMHVHYGNLRNVRPGAGDTDVNRFFNAHWPSLYSFLSPSVDREFAFVVRDFMDAMLPFLLDGKQLNLHG